MRYWLFQVFPSCWTLLIKQRKKKEVLRLTVHPKRQSQTPRRFLHNLLVRKKEKKKEEREKVPLYIIEKTKKNMPWQKSYLLSLIVKKYFITETFMLLQSKKILSPFFSYCNPTLKSFLRCTPYCSTIPLPCYSLYYVLLSFLFPAISIYSSLLFIV